MNTLISLFSAIQVDSGVDVAVLVGILTGTGVGGSALTSVLRKSKVMTSVKRSMQTADNIERLSDAPLEDIIKDSLEQFEQHQGDRDREAWKKHDACHGRIERQLIHLESAHDNIMETLLEMKEDIGVLKGKLAGGG